MKRLQLWFAALVLVLTVAIAAPAWADPPALTTTPAYTEVTQAIETLSQGELDVNTAQQLGQLKLQKYILETAKDWAQCQNTTGKTLAVYAHKGKTAQAPSTLYYLGDGQQTDDGWNCDGVYLPAGATVAGFGTDALTAPLAFTIVPGSQLVATANPDTGVVQFNLDPVKVLKAGEGALSIPSLTQADLDAQTPNAPIED